MRRGQQRFAPLGTRATADAVRVCSRAIGGVQAQQQQMEEFGGEGLSGLEGDRRSGQDVRSANMMACSAVANIVKSSLGPVGLDKMLVDDIGDTTVTNDGATILNLLEVEHPAGKVLVELAQLQDKEVGDGTTSVVVLAAELLRRANDLVGMKIHPTSIISGYRLAQREAIKCVLAPQARASLCFSAGACEQAMLACCVSPSVHTNVRAGTSTSGCR